MVKKNNVVKNVILVIVVVALMGLIVYLVGRSYGFFRYEKQGETTNVITIKGIRVDIIEDDDALNLLNTEPLYDSDGLELKAFKFSITNTSSRPLDYTMKVVNDTDKQSACLINEGTANEASCPVLTTDNIRYSYKLNNSNWVEPSNLGQDNDVITTYTINGGETLTYSIKMWIKSDATNDIMNHYFFGQLLIQGTQAAQEMYRPYDVATILSNFNQEDLKEVVACDNDNRYTNCSIYNTIEEAISAKSKSVIILTSDIDRDGVGMSIPAGKDVTLDLNGKKMESTGGATLIVNYGRLIVDDTAGFGQMVNTNYYDICSEKDSYTLIKNGKFITSGGRSPLVLGSLGTGNEEFIIDGQEYNETTGFGVYAQNTVGAAVRNDNKYTSLDINGGTFISGGTNGTAQVTSTGILNINGGTYTNTAGSTILNSSTGTININQTEKPIYIASLAESFKPVIVNLSTGTINITANQANQCTATSTDTTSGLCVYGNATGNGAVRNVDGIININGGTYYGNEQGTHNGGTGTYNIKNATIICQKSAIYNHSTGTYNICDTTINSITSKDISNVSTGAVNYNNVTFSTGTTTPDSSKITGTITEAATCPIPE